MNLIVLGLILDIIGVLILVIMSIFNPWHQKREDLKFWQKRYYWHSWIPLYKNTKTLKWKIKWNRIVLVYGFIPPKYKGDIMGFTFILIAFVLQLKFYLS